MFKLSKTIKLAIIIMIFLLGAFFTLNFTNKQFMETFVNEKKNCFDLLIKKGTNIYLYNSGLEYVPGINPIQFNNLEEYTEYVEWERAKGFNCPVLFLQHEYDSQNNSTYKLRPSPNNLEGGLNIHAASTEAEKKLNLDDKIMAFNSILHDIEKNDDIQTLGKPRKTANAMDSNWGGTDYSRKMVADGHFTKHDQDTRFDQLYMPPEQS
tara:strand:+ start:774 stop:1400 length:627 start_codon:yes stop_codon:yes gene_type:complete